MMDEARKKILADDLAAAFRGEIVETTVFRGEVTHLLRTSALKAVCGHLKMAPGLKMNYLVDVVGVDYFDRSPRFEVVYHLYSTVTKLRLRLKVRVHEGEEVPSVTDIWRGADYPEREAYDMFGIVFAGHPDLKRIYLADDWEGFPLRKDYPLRGYKDEYNPYGEERE